jgi:hypothetical protein
MAQMDAFSAQIVKFVREMPDEALLDLVKQKLGVIGASALDGGAGRTGRGGAMRVLPVAPPAAVAKGKRARASSKADRASRRPIPPTAERQGMLDSVERIVRASAGLSASDVASSAGIPQTRAAAALKELKLAKRIFQGGDRRFARYAGDSKTAEQASTLARQNAKGPTVPRPRAGARAASPAPRAAAGAPPPAPRPRKRAQPPTTPTS